MHGLRKSMRTFCRLFRSAGLGIFNFICCVVYCMFWNRRSIDMKNFPVICRVIIETTMGTRSVHFGPFSLCILLIS